MSLDSKEMRAIQEVERALSLIARAEPAVRRVRGVAWPWLGSAIARKIATKCLPQNRAWCTRVAREALRFFSPSEVMKVVGWAVDSGVDEEVPAEVALAYLASPSAWSMVDPTTVSLEPLVNGSFTRDKAQNSFPGMRVGQPRRGGFLAWLGLS